MPVSVNPADVADTEADRGRLAHRPRDIAWRGWWDVFWRVKDQLDADNVSIVAGGLALFGLMALFPSLAAAVAIYGIIASPEAIAAQIQTFAALLPAGTVEILQNQLYQLVSQRNETLSIGVIAGILVAIWSARKGMVALITAMNVAYNEHDHRSFLMRMLISFGFTLGGVLGFLLLVAIGVAVPIVLAFFPFGNATEWVLLTVRWALLWVMAVFAFSVLYRFAPHRTHPRWEWVNAGSIIAATLWLIGSALFALYVRNFNSFGEAYGAIGGVVVMLMWFYVSSYVVILGAEINSELERQTVNDTTVGPGMPMGRRGAYSADTVGPRGWQWKRASKR
ncbi:MAG TPA: YihY/virulence factor BrkB family protein [Steroidobacter sp.]|uniref:YihY/virulence factor BrkB family protein n=1 Tax=Steroidobacter sp. TaxID=1978227 RepID=UPI002ED7FE61